MRNLVILLAIVLIAAPAGAVFAVGLGDAATGLKSAGAPTLLGADLPTTSANVVTAIIGIVGTIFFLLIVYAGILWMSAAGNEERITKARKIVIDSAIGLFITLASYGITSFISGRLGGGAGGGEAADNCARAHGGTCMDKLACEKKADAEAFEADYSGSGKMLSVFVTKDCAEKKGRDDSVTLICCGDVNYVAE